jgi:polar amino acid transport system permease protein
MWDINYALRVLPEIALAFVNSFIITVVAFTVALVLGVLCLWGETTCNSARIGLTAVSDFVRRTPLLVQLYFAFYALPSFGINMTAWTTGIVVLSWHYGFYLAEVYRAAIAAVPKGQWEASRALGLTIRQIYTRVIVPQALPVVVPNAGNYLIYMFKDTPYLAAITVVEAMQVSLRLGSETFRYIEPITICGLLFLLASWASAWCIGWVETRSRGKWATR